MDLHLWLHHTFSSFIRSCLSELRVNFPMKLSCSFTNWFWIIGISTVFDRLSHLWFYLFSLVSLWRQVSSWYSDVGKIPVFSEVRRIGPSSCIPIVEYLWGYQGRSSICCRGQRMCPSKIDSMPLLKRRWRRLFSQQSSRRKNYTTQIFQDIWNALWRL